MEGIVETEKKQSTHERNLYFIRSMYSKLLVKKATKGEDTSRIVDRLRSVELKIWAMGGE
jgi:hypothetical protein